MAAAELDYEIQNLPPELREMILKKYISNKIKERLDLGFSSVHYEMKLYPFCEKNQQLTKITQCGKCYDLCERNDWCCLCLKNGKNHFLGYPIKKLRDFELFAPEKKFISFIPLTEMKDVPCALLSLEEISDLID